MNNPVDLLLNATDDKTTNKKPYQKKYKCCYCEERLERPKLHIHIQNKHEDLIPEGFTALRLAFNIVNNKTEGHCIICKGVSDWDENKGRYNRLCNDPKCKEEYKKLVAKRNQNIYGTDRLQTDPRYREEVQRKALAGRKIGGKYKFKDGGEIQYLGLYEKKFLEFVDLVMNCKSEDILAPGPAIEYFFNGTSHIYLPDFYYAPYNLLIEIKDGGENPNMHPKRLGEDEARMKAKEAAVERSGMFHYVRVVDNNFGQLMGVMASIKYMEKHHRKDKIIKVNEAVNEAVKLIPPDPTQDGFYEEDEGKNLWNSIIKYKGKSLRERAEVLIIKDNEEVYLDIKDATNMYYRLPGGGTEHDKSIESQAIRECQEESHITPKDLKYYGFYTQFYPKPKDSRYEGYYTHYFVGKYDKKFTGKVDKADRDESMIKNGKFYPIEGVYHMLKEEHRKAIDDYTGNKFSYMKNKSLEESFKFTEDLIYHLSPSNLDDRILVPTVPNNFMTKYGYEDNKTKRVAFTPNIDYCLRALSENLTGKTFYVHVVDRNKCSLAQPSLKEVPDVEITEEIWVIEPVKVKCVGRIQVIGPSELDIEYKYNYGPNGKYTASLYDWKWKWDRSFKINESSSFKSDLEKDYKSKGKKSLSSFKQVNVDKTFLKEHKGELPHLGSLRPSDDINKSTAWMDDNTIIGYICISNPKDDKWKDHIWGAALEVNPEYKGYGLGEQIFKWGIKNGINALGVAANNKIAIQLYEKYGFVISKEDSTTRNLIMYKKSFMNESADASKLDSDFNVKERYDLSKYKKTVKDNTSDGIKSEYVVWKDGSKKVCQVWADVDKASDGNIWFGSLEVSKAYRGHGLSEQILEYIIKNYHSNALTVYKDNEVAINLYKKYGFKIVKNASNVSDEYYTMIRKSSLNESYIINEKDIYYNKDKFDSGEINLCFITGLSGSGKSTMGRELSEKYNVEHYELDDLGFIADHFTMEQLKEYGDLIYSYFNGEGKKFYITKQDAIDNKIPGSEYEDKMYPGFIHYAMNYAKSHKDRKFVLEGVWLFCSDEKGKKWFKPEEFKDYAFYIKGTSALISHIRAAKRDSKDGKNKLDRVKALTKLIFNKTHIKWYLISEKEIRVFRDYFKKLEKNSLNESVDFDTKLNRNDILAILSEFKYPRNQFIVSFKAALVLHGIVEESNDIDLIITPTLETQLIRDGYERTIAPLGNNRYEINPRLECFVQPKLTKDFVNIDGYKVESIERLIEIYKNRGREKDKNTLDIIFRHIPIYHISDQNFDGKIMRPKLPSYMTKSIIDQIKSGEIPYENYTTKRISFSKSIKGCLMSIVPVENVTQEDIASLIIGKEFYVNIPADNNYTYKDTSEIEKEVFDAKRTQEVWITSPVKIKCIGKIKVTKALLDTKKKYIDFDYEWINKNMIKESMGDVIGAALAPNPLPYESNKDNYYIIQYPQNNVFNYTITKDPVQYSMLSVDPEEKGFYKVFKSDKKKINNKYLTFKIKDRQSAKELYDELAMIESTIKDKTFFDNKYNNANNYIYARLTEGNSIVSDDQLLFDSRFELVKNPEDEINEICDNLYNYLMNTPIQRLEEQIADIVESTGLSGIKENYDEFYYSETGRLLESLSVKMMNSNESNRGAIREEISKLGWNPEIPFNKESSYRVSKYKISSMNESNEDVSNTVFDIARNMMI